jgi:UDP-N-acetylmuramate dehydrogenase
MNMNLLHPCEHSLKSQNTFGIAAHAQHYLRIQHADELINLHHHPDLKKMPRLILGGGSNLILADEIHALVLKIDLRGKGIIGQNEEVVFVRAEAGESWHEFVQWTLQQGLGGLENLSLIPGTVGAAPIQNIGAYGVELKDHFYELTAFDFVAGQIITLNKEECQFAYRDSVFKHAYKDRMVVLSVSFALPKKWQAQISYGDVAQQLAQRGITKPTAQEISATIMQIRQSKLPDPNVIGNAGSFFKNPIVSEELRSAVLVQHSSLVSYPQESGGYKLAAGWLIEQSGWKGKRVGNVGVFEKQALVLVNHGGATGMEVRALAAQIQADVKHKFGVDLEVEPVFVE